ncbi:hypothetical protein FPSE_08114 [Fusarium pseudograminearum CS3096]|uniref:Uncharacterized protein n=2 Tax=Fusarium pseudograminearum TaxID=101028 RepID=K3VFR1_FUSPC|nr:hypothetical protein FPSE_08114 [Fusarium pseudograminearum CS3096]EKJ71668.1 hypothetical protein FPSE_08114 [Fusarium pseudograminearum CS3096]KAF0645957.1 hypothetical protein FPSE5266_08114 [Fusarium pseudograminearum]CEG02655.1 unnamed protein product [Fusarium pseudograminearum CS3427]
MSGAEILAALAIIEAAADTVTKVVDALQTGKDFIDSFSDKKDYSRELENYIDQAKKSIQAEIQAVELQGYMNVINGAALWYYGCQKTIKEFGISKHTVQDPDGELLHFSQDIMSTIGRLNEMKLWIESDTRPRPTTPKMLGVYLTYYAIRHSLIVTYEAFEFARTGHHSSTIGDLVQNLKDAQDVLSKRFNAYQSVRASQLVLFRRSIPGDPPGTGGLTVRADNGGDTLIPNIPVGTTYDYTYNGFTIIREAWNSTEFGKTTIPDLFKTYNGAYKAGLSLLTPRQLEQIEVFEHFIIAGQI